MERYFSRWASLKTEFHRLEWPLITTSSTSFWPELNARGIPKRVLENIERQKIYNTFYTSGVCHTPRHRLRVNYSSVFTKVFIIGRRLHLIYKILIFLKAVLNPCLHKNGHKDSDGDDDGDDDGDISKSCDAILYIHCQLLSYFVYEIAE